MYVFRKPKIKTRPKACFEKTSLKLFIAEFVYFRKHIGIHFGIILFVKNFVARALVNFYADVFHSQFLIHLFEFFNVARVLPSDRVLLAAENRNGTVFSHFCKIFLFIDIRKTRHKIFIEGVGHHVTALFVVAIFFNLLDVARKPREIVPFFAGPAIVVAIFDKVLPAATMAPG